MHIDIIRDWPLILMLLGVVCFIVFIACQKDHSHHDSPDSNGSRK